MLFNSLDFAIFLPIVFLLYWKVANRDIKLQNLLILISSYVFYAWWDWRFLLLIILSTCTDFIVSNSLFRQKKLSNRKLLLSASIVLNIGLLGFFKYFNFFIESFNSAFSVFGLDISMNTLSLILPVGISFYTFQTLSYTIDIYRKKIKPTRDFIAFSAFVGFFPQLVAGPIERAANLLPQFSKPRIFLPSAAIEGLRQMLWGLFKKVVIADNCALFVNEIFENSELYNGSTLLLGAVFFAFQIYGDFSGYSDIAIGTAKLFGFNLMKNFAYPYFSRDIAEFWRRWHISLSSWFRDYIYIPLGGSKRGTLSKIRNTFIIFLVSGFWHGANWTFIAWGFLNALYFLPLLLTKRNRLNLEIVSSGRRFPSIPDLAKMGFTFFITTIAWVFFRAESIQHAIQYLKGIFSPSFFELPHFPGIGRSVPVIILIAFLLIVEWIGREKDFAISHIGQSLPRFQRWAIYSFILFLIGMYMQTGETPFIYFQF